MLSTTLNNVDAAWVVVPLCVIAAVCLLTWLRLGRGGPPAV
jgi:hypothetical protein